MWFEQCLEAGLDWDQKMALSFLAMAAHYDIKKKGGWFQIYAFSCPKNAVTV